jgi:hypothetical protein
MSEETTGSGSFRKEEGQAPEGMAEQMNAIRDRRAVARGFLIVALVAALFLGYGIFMYLTIGDKGPPDWDFGAVVDTPAESVYSTGLPGATEPQHVNRMPSGAGAREGSDSQ